MVVLSRANNKHAKKSDNTRRSGARGVRGAIITPRLGSSIRILVWVTGLLFFFATTGTWIRSRYLLFLAGDGEFLSSLSSLSLSSLSSSSSLSSVSLSREAFDALTQIRESIVCQNVTLQSTPGWSQLCRAHILQQADQILSNYLNDNNNVVHIVQIGAHTGFDINDPTAAGLAAYLRLLPPDNSNSNDNSHSERQRVHWHFVEPSPTTYKALERNLAMHPGLCHMVPINAAIVPDADKKDTTNNNNSNNTAMMTFYGIRDTVDPLTLLDTRSGKTFPNAVSQISSASKAHVLKHHSMFRQIGLDIQDYIVELQVPTRSFSNLMQGIMTISNGNTGNNNSMPTTASAQQAQQAPPPLIVLIDTEGMDCNIILGIANHSNYWPRVLYFERMHCAPEDYQATRQKLEALEYDIHHIGVENALAIRRLKL